MKRWMIAGALLIAGCAVQRPVGFLRSLPAETPQECEQSCGSMGMRMTAVVVVASSAGCVCEPAKPTAARAGGASASAAGAIIAMRQREAGQQQSQPH